MTRAGPSTVEIPGDSFISRQRYRTIMSYRSALNLVELAKQAGLLGDEFVRDLIMVVAVDDDPELEKDIEDYIGLHVIDRLFNAYRTSRSYG